MDNQKISPKIIGTIIAVGLLSFCGVAIGTAANVSFPELSSQYQVKLSVVHLMTVIFTLATGATIPISISLENNFRTKSLFIFANIIFLIGLITNGLISFAIPNFLMLLVGHTIRGIGAGIALSLMFSIILEKIPKDKVKMMTGIGVLIIIIASAIGLELGNLILYVLSWHFISIFLIPISIISLVVGSISINKKDRL